MLEVGNGELRFGELFQAQDDEDEIEWIETEVIAQSIGPIDFLGIDPEVKRQSEADDFEIVIGHARIPFGA
jgi:hypothetical protein